MSLGFGLPAPLDLLVQLLLQGQPLAVVDRRGKVPLGGLPSLGDQPGVALAQVEIAASQGVGLGRQGLGLLILALLQASLPQVVQDRGVARLDAQRALQGRSGPVQLAGMQILGGALQQRARRRIGLPR
ncbi:hypothetical protein D3C80_1415370 [compost metagenome]